MATERAASTPSPRSPDRPRLPRWRGRRAARSGTEAAAEPQPVPSAPALSARALSAREAAAVTVLRDLLPVRHRPVAAVVPGGNLDNASSRA